ncbi:hypothetical protein SAMN04488058_104114 [Deinococcus reticulitermitis]|uniref:Uncharacterized protein n=1 Tax=Deinococcus reticulitermitis TaxID=856736 RepID=A0A1H6WNZ6_9DEIO|nr:hypothetical protein [Deinococcus reticulitermitis]SEJ14095.1 hypothetical protein SAMN04488058_104114 [Deinococcus reticulitermitis]
MSDQRGDPKKEATGTGLGRQVRGLAKRALQPGQQRGAPAEWAGDLAAEWRSRAEALRSGAREQADARLEALIEQRRTERGRPAAPEVDAALEARRRERVQRAERLRRREALLAQARTPDERRVLTRVAAATPWAGGEGEAPRYTTLLDGLAPGGDAAREMAIHRALWSLAERRVLAVSPHGEVTACQDPLDARTLPG